MNPTTGGTSVYDNPDLQAARTNAQNLSTQAGNESAASISLPDQLRSAISAKFDTATNPLYAQKEAATKDYLTASANANQSVTSKTAGGTSDYIYSPAQQAALIGQYKAPALAHLAMLNDLFGNATGGIQNIIDSTSRADQSYVTGLNARAQNANDSYKSILNELSARAAEADQNTKNAMEQQRLNKTANGNSTGNSVLDAIIAKMLGGGTPTPTPTNNDPAAEAQKRLDDYIKQYGVAAAQQQGLISSSSDLSSFGPVGTDTGVNLPGSGGGLKY